MTATENQIRAPRLFSILSYLLAILIPVLLVLGSIRLITTEPYLRLEYAKPDFPPDPYGMTREERLYFAPFVLHYMFSSEGINYLIQLTFENGDSVFLPEELKHLVDVKKVVDWAMLVLVGGIVIFAGIVLILGRSQSGRVALRRGLAIGGISTLAILGSLLAYVILDWDNFFTRFHNVFFAEGSWTFAYSDSLIRLFPIRFWQDAAITVGGLSAAGSLLLIGIAVWWSRQVR
jgi:integral membrane protein (TIGR01906 family)